MSKREMPPAPEPRFYISGVNFFWPFVRYKARSGPWSERPSLKLPKWILPSG